MAISETKGQGWRAIPTQWRKASNILTSTLVGKLSSPKCEILPRMPTNHRAKFGATSFILTGGIHNHTNTQNYKKQTNSNRHIHTLPIGMCGQWKWNVPQWRMNESNCSKEMGKEWPPKMKNLIQMPTSAVHRYSEWLNTVAMLVHWYKF